MAKHKHFIVFLSFYFCTTVFSCVLSCAGLAILTYGRLYPQNIICLWSCFVWGLSFVLVASWGV
ncbi:MAG: hypothetical protein PHE58_04555, partial [Candidatus Omnitrophica bacterium]|nr:hypothetical protein [Candidatus Omnitrophota bacterium]